MQQAQQVTEQASVTSNATEIPARPHHKGALDREMFCPQLARLLMGAASELGQRGNLAQVVASIERGGAGGGGEDPNYAALRRIGWPDDVDNKGRVPGVRQVVGQLRELGQRWQLLERRHQAQALAHYLGTPRAHHTLTSIFGHGQGGLAGVVLYRWQGKQAKARQRAAGAGAAAASQALEPVRVALAAVELELRKLRRLSRAAAPVPYLHKPSAKLALADPAVAEQLVAYHETIAAHRAVARFLAGLRGLDIDRQVAGLEAQARPLRAEQARLCAQLAALAATGDVVDDEQALVDLCRSDRLTPETKAGMLDAAAADVLALHRAWYATAKKLAARWVEGEEPAA